MSHRAIKHPARPEEDPDGRRLSEREARALTDEVKADAAALWATLLRLYEGEAHTALGYSSWGVCRVLIPAEYDTPQSKPTIGRAGGELQQPVERGESLCRRSSLADWACAALGPGSRSRTASRVCAAAHEPEEDD